MIWLDKTATVRNQQHFDDVAQRKYYVDMFRLQAPSVSAHLPSLQQQALRSSSCASCLQCASRSTLTVCSNRSAMPTCIGCTPSS